MPNLLAVPMPKNEKRISNSARLSKSVPLTSQVSQSNSILWLIYLTICLIFFLGGVVVEVDENDRLVAKPFNVAEANKLKQQEMENAEV